MKQSKISQILNNLIGQKIDYDGVYGHQCVDLVYYVLREVYGMKNWLNLRNGAAKDMAHPEAYREFASQLEFIPNTPEFIPQVGDICVTLGGQYHDFWGHTFMILAGSSTSQMHTLEQNTGNGDGKGEDDRTLDRWRNYDNILTFVRWKGIENNQTITINNNQDTMIFNKMRNIINNDASYDAETVRVLNDAINNKDIDYVLAFSGGVIRDELQRAKKELELVREEAVKYKNMYESEINKPVIVENKLEEAKEVPVDQVNEVEKVEKFSAEKLLIGRIKDYTNMKLDSGFLILICAWVVIIANESFKFGLDSSAIATVGIGLSGSVVGIGTAKQVKTN